MKKKTVILISAAHLIFLGCGKKEIEVEIDTPDGKAKIGLSVGKEESKVSTTEYDLNKMPWDNLEFANGKASILGKKEPFTGTALTFHSDGSKASETPFVDGKVHGTKITYWSSGSISREIPYVNGRLHGKRIEFNSDGTEDKETTYEDGKRISHKKF